MTGIFLWLLIIAPLITFLFFFYILGAVPGEGALWGILGLYLIIALFSLAVYVARRADIYIGRVKLGWLLAGYFAVLICSPVILQLLPPERLSRPVDAAALRKAEAAARDLFPAATAGRPGSVEGVRKLGEWQLSLAGDSLKITGTHPDRGLNVLVERKDDNDGIIEATHYIPGAILEMTDVSAQVRPVEVTLTENTLMITEPEYYKIEVIRFRPDFMAAQILGDDAARRQFHFQIGNQLLYLRVPQGVQIEESHHHLYFVNRDPPVQGHLPAALRSESRGYLIID